MRKELIRIQIQSLSCLEMMPRYYMGENDDVRHVEVNDSFLQKEAAKGAEEE